MSNSNIPARTRRTIEMGGKPIEVSELHAPLTFVRKPATLKEVLAPCARLHPELRAKLRPSALPQAAFTVLISETRNLTQHEYDVFAASLLESREWLNGKGGHPGNGFPNEARLCIEVTAPGRLPLIIDPERYDYARYVACLA